MYGFLAGNEVFAFASRVIRESVTAHGTPDDFIGLLGDEFVILTGTTSNTELRDDILKRFKDGINAFYSFNDVERGALLLNPGTKQEKQAPLMQLVQVQEDL